MTTKVLAKTLDGRVYWSDKEYADHLRPYVMTNTPALMIAKANGRIDVLGDIADDKTDQDLVVLLRDNKNMTVDEMLKALAPVAETDETTTAVSKSTKTTKTQTQA